MANMCVPRFGYVICVCFFLSNRGIGQTNIPSIVGLKSQLLLSRGHAMFKSKDESWIKIYVRSSMQYQSILKIHGHCCCHRKAAIAVKAPRRSWLEFLCFFPGINRINVATVKEILGEPIQKKTEATSCWDYIIVSRSVGSFIIDVFKKVVRKSITNWLGWCRRRKQ